jgi:hypothetical protein
MSKCKLWSPSRISLGIEIPQGYTLVINGLHILGVLVSSQDFTMHFLDEALYHNMVHIDNLPLLGNTQVVLGILSSCVACDLLISHEQYFLLLPSCFFYEFQQESYVDALPSSLIDSK